MSEVLSVELSAEDKARLEWVSEKTQRSEADLLREAAQEYLDDLEDYYLGVEAMQTL
ncbi:ribbon-helix-helix protein, CopG family, partial [Mobiluncus mulieris]|nr:ribbon-helix-helix protein, CopG family [Mobiluncus mulieris]